MSDTGFGPETVSTFTGRRRAQLLAAPDSGFGPVPDWLSAQSCTSPTLSPDGAVVAFVSDRDGAPALWVTPLSEEPSDAAHPVDRAVRLETGPDHVREVRWSPDGRRLACLLAPGGGEHTRVLVLRPDGTDPRLLAGGSGQAATLGPWLADSTGLGIAVAGGRRRGDPTAFVVDPDSGQHTRLATGPAAQVCTFSPDGRHAVVRVGRRGARELWVVHIRSGRQRPLLTAGDTGDVTVADARFAIDGSRLYVHTDAGRERAVLLALPWSRAGLPEDAYGRHFVVAARPDADLDAFAVCGATIAAVWNVAGYSELDLIEPDFGRQRALPVPADVITGVTFARDRSGLLVTAQGPALPPHLVHYSLRCTSDAADPIPHRLEPAAAPAWAADDLVTPILCRFVGGDGLELAGWHYSPRGARGPLPTVIWLHGGPEAQERPTFAPLHQALLAAGLAVFAPNVRGSSGYGRRFVNADNHDRRFAAIGDVAAAVEFLVGSGLADPARIGCAGRSYGGYLTLAALVAHPELFRVGVDVCGMADLETFFAHTEPWIASAATSKYGDPSRDAALLRELSPLHRIDQLVAPLLVVHGQHDTNVPLAEAEQVVTALRERGAAPGYLLFPDEGHEIHQIANRATFVRAVVQWMSDHLLDAAEQTA